MIIPKELRNDNFRFALATGKKPIEKMWNTERNYKYNDIRIKSWKGNILIIAGLGNLIILDIDQIKGIDVLNNLPETLLIKTGSGKYHAYFYTDDTTTARIHNEKGTVFDLLGNKTGALCPFSIHPDTKNAYQIEKSKKIAYIKKETLLKECSKYSTKQIQIKKANAVRLGGGGFKGYQAKKYSFKISDLLKAFDISIHSNPTDTPLTDNSNKKKCFSFNDDKAIWFCHHTGEGGTLRRLLYVLKKKNRLPAGFEV